MFGFVQNQGGLQMSERAESTRPWMKWARRLGLAIGVLLVTVPALLLVGANVPSLAYVGGYGSLAVSLWSAWLVVLSLTGGVLIWVCSRGNVRRLLIALALLTVFCAATATYRLVALARANGVQVTAVEPFGFSGSLASVPPDEVLVYTRDLGEALNLLIYRPKGQPPYGGWPILMYVHGGGWISNSNTQRSADMRWFANQGLEVLSINYSLSDTRRHLWDRVTDQLGCALAWTDGNVASKGGDPSRISLIGDSAGGNLVINAGYLANADKLQSSCGGHVPHVNAVSAMYPGVDLVSIHNNTYRPTGPDVRDMVLKYIGGSPQQFPERYAAVASAAKITPAAPPTLLFITENDHLVPLDSVRAFDAKARKAGIQVRTVSVPYGEHVFDATGIGNAIVRQVTLQFLKEHDHSF
jgi:acetyl esterase/lipase